MITGLDWNTALLMMPLTIGSDVAMPVFEPEEDILKIHCDTNYSKRFWLTVIISVKIYCSIIHSFQTVANFLIFTFLCFD